MEHYTPHAGFQKIYETDNGEEIIFIPHTKRIGILADAEDGSHYQVPSNSLVYMNPRIIELEVENGRLYHGYVKAMENREYMLYRVPKALALFYQPYSYIWVPTQEYHWLHETVEIKQMFNERFIKLPQKMLEEES